MINNQEIVILELLSRKLLAKSEEIKSEAGGNGVSDALQRLVAMDYVKSVEPIGEKCFVITQKGSKILKEMKNPEKRVVKHGFMTS